MVLLGANPTGRVVEQHDYYFGIAEDLEQLVPAIKAFWPETGHTLHVDGWREINYVDGYKISVKKKTNMPPGSTGKHLFFINLGGYTAGKLEEQHYTMLCISDNPRDAVKYAKSSPFFVSNSIHTPSRAAVSHIDEKYGIDVDDLFRVDDLLADDQKAIYTIEISPISDDFLTDEVHLGYLRLDKLHSRG
jgi:hypothetical protein